MSAINFRDECSDLLRCNRGAPPVIPGAVDAVFTVVDTVVALQNFQQRDTASVGRKAVADTAGDRIAEMSLFSGTVHTAGSARNVIFGRVSEKIQLLGERKCL